MKVLTSILIFSASVLALTNIEDVQIRTIGAPNTLDFKLYYEYDGEIISAFHDIPLFANENQTLYNMIVEIPRWSNAKNEINKENVLNPIIQDVSDGKPRFVPNIFPFKGYSWNYGAFPQTWEDPNYTSPFTNKKGDNDPIDVIEIGSSVANVGEIMQVKILGIIGLLDEDETDWKVIVINSKDPLFEKLNDVSDIEKYMPGLLEGTNTFFETYKIPSGKDRNSIAFDGEAQDRVFAKDIVLETHQHWKLLINGTTQNNEIQRENRLVENSPFILEKGEFTLSLEQSLPPAKIPNEVDTWYYIKEN